MARIYPFRGVRYNLAKVGDLSLVVTQPYDRIGPQEQTIYYQRSPHNIVRIIFGKEEPGDDGENKYTRAARFFAEWLRDGIIVRDRDPAIYAYHQEFNYDGELLKRKGLTVLLDLRDAGGIKAHERTLAGPKEDRLKLMRETEANFGQIFMLYRDPSRWASETMEAALRNRPTEGEACDDFGNHHLLWPVTDAAAIKAVQTALTDLPLYIADGHHRFEVARTFMGECLEKGWRPVGVETFTSCMVTVVNTAEPGLVIRPINRVIHSLPGFDPDQFLWAVEADFRVELLRSEEEARARLAQGRGREHVFIAYIPKGRFYALSLRDEGAIERLVPGKASLAWKSLDVTILHQVILDRILGIDEERLAREANVRYVYHSWEETLAAADREGQLAFLLNPTRVEEVMAVADQGERMPQKSTDFYPKLLTGLVGMKMEIEKT